MWSAFAACQERTRACLVQHRERECATAYSKEPFVSNLLVLPHLPVGHEGRRCAKAWSP